MDIRSESRAELSTANQIELEIQSLLYNVEASDLVADALVKKYEPLVLDLESMHVLSQFFLKCGFYFSLMNFITNKLQDGSQIPWAHYVEAIFQSSAAVEPEIKKALVDGAKNDSRLKDLIFTRHLDAYDEEIPKLRSNQAQLLFQEEDELRRELVQQLEILRSQDLVQEEEKLIQKLKRIFPRDESIEKLRTEQKEKKALEIINTKPKKNKPYVRTTEEPNDKETMGLLKTIEMEMLKAASDKNHRDFSLAHLLWNNPDGALRILDQSTDPDPWLRAEILLHAHRFAELLDFLSDVEVTLPETPDNAYAIIYLKSQALWGLNKKMQAIEMLESLIAVHPNYRSAQALLIDWKDA